MSVESVSTVGPSTALANQWSWAVVITWPDIMRRVDGCSTSGCCRLRVRRLSTNVGASQCDSSVPRSLVGKGARTNVLCQHPCCTDLREMFAIQ
jgi:hypothetical protein